MRCGWRRARGVAGLAAGAVIGSALHLGIQVPGLIRFGFRWQPILDARNPAVRQVARIWAARARSGRLSSDTGGNHQPGLPAGTGPGQALEWGWDAMQLPETIIGTAFGLVVFPTLADLAMRRDQDGLRRTPPSIRLANKGTSGNARAMVSSSLSAWGASIKITSAPAAR